MKNNLTEAKFEYVPAKIIEVEKSQVTFKRRHDTAYQMDFILNHSIESIEKETMGYDHLFLAPRRVIVDPSINSQLLQIFTN